MGGRGCEGVGEGVDVSLNTVTLSPTPTLAQHPQDDEKALCTLTKIQICQDQMHM